MCYKQHGCTRQQSKMKSQKKGPAPYDMSNPDDLERWFREMAGYLRVDKFLSQGTDTDGRRYALDGFGR